MVLAHDDEPRLELVVERASPGASLTVRGSGFPYDATVALSIMGGADAGPAGRVQADAEGAFTVTLVLPVDLAEGTYTVRADTDAGGDPHAVECPPFVVGGAPIVEGEDGDGRREEEDGLLAPMPSAAGVASSHAAVPPTTPASAAPVPATSMPSDPGGSLFVLVSALGAAAIVAGAVAIRRRRTGADG